MTTLAAFFGFSRGGRDSCVLTADHVIFDITSLCSYHYHMCTARRSSTPHGGRCELNGRVLLRVEKYGLVPLLLLTRVSLNFVFVFIFACDGRPCCVFFCCRSGGGFCKRTGDHVFVERGSRVGVYPVHVYSTVRSSTLHGGRCPSNGTGSGTLIICLWFYICRREGGDSFAVVLVVVADGGGARSCGLSSRQ